MEVWVEMCSESGVHRGSLKLSANKQKQNQSPRPPHPLTPPFSWAKTPISICSEKLLYHSRGTAGAFVGAKVNYRVHLSTVLCAVCASLVISSHS